MQIANKSRQKIKSLKNHNFRPIQVIHINFIPLESDLKDLYKYINSNTELLNYKITLEYLTELELSPVMTPALHWSELCWMFVGGRKGQNT